VAGKPGGGGGLRVAAVGGGTLPAGGRRVDTNVLNSGFFLLAATSFKG